MGSRGLGLGSGPRSFGGRGFRVLRGWFRAEGLRSRGFGVEGFLGVGGGGGGGFARQRLASTSTRSPRGQPCCCISLGVVSVREFNGHLPVLGSDDVPWDQGVFYGAGVRVGARDEYAAWANPTPTWSDPPSVGCCSLGSFGPWSLRPWIFAGSPGGGMPVILGHSGSKLSWGGCSCMPKSCRSWTRG